MMGWSRFLRIVLLATAGLLATAYGFIVLMNPFGHLPWRAFGAHVIMDINQRFQYPSIARARMFDSAVIGTSTSRLLDPDRLDAKLGGRFANLAMNDARAWEQYRLARLFLEQQPHAATLLVALDRVWCDQNADVDRVTSRGFPEWLYDDAQWNDWLYLLNPRTLEFSGRLALHRLGLKPPRIPANGFEVFVPPESAYDPVKVNAALWPHGRREIKPQAVSYVPSAQERRSWQFPALAWLEEILSSASEGTRRILVFMPVHISAQPAPGSAEAAREQACKSRISEIAARRKAMLVDFRIHSGITASDANYWDPLHYRLPIAARIVDGIAQATATRLDDPGGDWLFIKAPD